MRARRGGTALGAVIALAAGGLLFGAAWALERATGATVTGAGAIEELGKALAILSSGLLCMYRTTRGQDARRRMPGAARGLSLGLAAAAAFAAIENGAYFLAFPEAGLLARLAWSLPVHLDAALVEALGAVPLLRLLATRPATRAGAGGARQAIPSRRIATLAGGGAAFAAATAAAAALHALANGIVDRSPPAWILAAGSLTGFTALAALAAAFIDTAYIGGFLHGTEQRR